MSLSTDFKRIIRAGFINFMRNPVVSFVSVLDYDGNTVHYE